MSDSATDRPSEEARTPSGAGNLGANEAHGASSPACDLQEAQLWSWIDRDDSRLEQHLEHCPHCRRLAAEYRSGIGKLAGTPTVAAPGGGAQVPPRIGPCRIVREISRGGMGIVYLGVREDDHFQRHVAVKVLKRGLETEDVLRRFELERQVLAALNHAGIARLYDAGETGDGRPYFVMEYVEGVDIAAYCDHNRLTIAERLDLFGQVCAAVHYAHQNLVVHRDLKPGNILVTKDGQPKLLDFGIAKLVNPELSIVAARATAPEFRVMTPEYASPEQVRGDPVTTASDVYTLGVLLYELVSGHRPYHLRSRVRAEIERVICEEDPEKPSTAISRVEETPDSDATGVTATITPESVSRTRREGRPDRLRRRLAGDIDNIVLMAMRKEPRRRYASAAQLADDIRRHAAGRPVIARTDTPLYRAVKFVQRNRLGVAAALLIVLLLVAGVVGTTGQWRAAEAARQVADEERRHAVEERQRAETARGVAERERERADRRFHEVRALARTFMFDFHDAIVRLAGSLGARELLVRTALEYLDALAQEVGDDPDLTRELAAGYDRVGDLLGGLRGSNLGDTAGALEHYRTAESLRATLVAARPDDVELRRELSSSHMKVGDMLKRQGDLAGALDAYREALAIRTALYDDEPHVMKTALGLVQALGSVGDALLYTGDDEAALAVYERSLAIRRRLVERWPDDRRLQRTLSSACLRVAERYRSIGRADEAEDAYREALRIRRRLAASDPHSGRAKRDLAVARLVFGDFLVSRGRSDDALESLDAALPAFESLLEADPEDVRAKSTLAAAHQSLSLAHAAREDWAPALEHGRSLLRLGRALVAADAANTVHQRLVAYGHERIGEALAATGRPAEASASLDQGLAVVERLAEADSDDVRLREDRARMRTALGAALREDDRRADAARHLDAALLEYEALRADRPDDVEFRAGLATALHELARARLDVDDGRAAIDLAERSRSVRGEPDPALLRDLAAAYFLAGDRDAARRAARLAVDALRDRSTPSAEALRATLQDDLRRYDGG